MFIRTRITGALGLILAPALAHAHSFGAGTDHFAGLIEGMSVILFEPITLFACLSLGLLITLLLSGGVMAALPYLIGSTVLGFLIATLAPGAIGVILLIIGVLSATAAAVFKKDKKIIVLAATVLTGICTLMVALEGHTWMELTAAIYLGLILGTYFCVVLAAVPAEVLLEKFADASWSRISVRIAASWLAAVQILVLAFQFVPVPAA